MQKRFIIITFLVVANLLFAQDKLRIAMMDFSNSGGLSEQESLTLANRLRTMLVKTDAFIVLERGKMQEILDEQGFQQSGCTSSECAVEAGKLLNVQKMLNGSIGKLGKTYTLDISLIDVETAEIEQTFYEDYKGEIDGLLEKMQEIAVKVANFGKKPAAPATVIKRTFRIASNPEGAYIIINGTQIGKTPYVGKVNDGTQLNITLRLSDYKDWQKLVTIAGDEEISAELQPLKTAPVAQETQVEEKSSKVWYWIGGGAAVLGGAAYFLLAGEESKPEPASFPAPPGRPSSN